MNNESTRVELRVRMFDAAFKSCSRREWYLTMYLSLREEGDSHSTAVETIRGEILMAHASTTQPFPKGRW